MSYLSHYDKIAMDHFGEQLNALFPSSDVKHSSYISYMQMMEVLLWEIQRSHTEYVYRECCQLYYLRLGLIDSKEYRRTMGLQRDDPINVDSITQLQPAPFKNIALQRQVLALKEKVEFFFSLNFFKQGYAFEMLDVEKHLVWMLSEFPLNEYLISCRLYYLRMGHVKSLKLRSDLSIPREDLGNVEVLGY